MPGTIATTLTGGVAARTVDAVKRYGAGSTAVRELGRTIVMVTHDPVAAGSAARVVFLADGRVAGELLEPTADAVLGDEAT